MTKQQQQHKPVGKHNTKNTLLKLLIQEKALVRLLKTIGREEYHTRELLKKLGAYGYGHKLLLRAQKNGLVQRRTIKNKIYNKLTKKGRDLVKLAVRIGV
jgi:predicted membrane chloride channel (bestrophin family)